jgi:hypothetical protein
MKSKKEPTFLDFIPKKPQKKGERYILPLLVSI